MNATDATKEQAMSLYHAEAKKDEVFVGNLRGELPDHLRTLKTARLGNKAFDIDGKILSQNENIRPLFIGQSEAGDYDRIMMRRTFPNDPRFR